MNYFKLNCVHYKGDYDLDLTFKGWDNRFKGHFIKQNKCE